MTESSLPEESIFAQALEISSAAERSAFLDRACGDNQALRGEVEALLRAHELSGDLLDRPEKLPVTSDLPGHERPGTLLGPYKLLEQIGEGGMGTVWMAEQTEPIQRRVAVKVVKDGMDSRQVLARFEAEQQALALMEHPNIAKVLDAGQTPSGRPYFVMELVKGQPITKYCDEKRLPVRERLELLGDVCRAVQHAHQKGIIHRDLKPSNVLVAPYDGKPVVKVIDFGVAKAMGQRLTDKTLFTGFGALVGTPEYMSPEQAEVNNQDIDTRSDIYTLGVLLYELLTGSTPLTRKRMKEAAFLEVLRVIREEEPPRPSTRLSESKDSLPSISAQRQMEPAKLTKLVRGELDWMVMKALEKDRNRRYETANGFAMDVQRYLHDEPIQAGPPSTTYRLRKFARRNKGVLTAAALISAALVLAVVVLAISNVRINDALGQAKINAETADQRAEDLAHRLYIDQVNLAHREILANNAARADALLADCEPSRRGWEWAFTKRLCHLEAMTLGGFRDHASAVEGARRASPATVALLAAHATDSTIASLGAGNGSVRSVAYSPDGRRIASAHDDGSIVLWDARTGQEIRSLIGHLGSVSSVTFDDQGARLISGGFDGTVRIWDANTGQEQFVLRGHSRPVMSVAFRPGANQAASSEHGGFKTYLTPGFEIKQWDLLRGREIRTLHHAPGWSYSWVAFTPDGRRLLSSSCWSGQLHIWDAESGKKVEERPHPFPNHGLSVSPADGRMAFGYQDGSVGLSDSGLGLGIRSLRGHGSQDTQVAFSRDGTRLASASGDATITVWSVADGREVKHLRGHTDAVTAMAFSPKGDSLVSGSSDGTVKIWHVGAARDPYPLNLKVWVNRVRFAPDGRRTAIVPFDAVMVVDSTSTRPLFRIHFPASVSALAFSPDGRLIATSASDQVRLLDAETGQIVADCQRHAGTIRAAAFGGGNLLASVGDDGTVRLWDVATGQAGAILDAHQAGTFSLAFNPARTMLASLDWDGNVCLWDVPKGRLIRNLGHTFQRKSDYWGDALAFSPDGRRLAVSCADGTVHVWEVASGDEVLSLRGHTREVASVAYNPDGRRIAAAGWDNTIKLWDAATGDEVFTLRGHTGGVLGLAFSPDGLRLLSAGADGMVRAWDATPLEVKPATTLEPRSAAEWNAEGAWYETLHLWDEAVHAYTKVIELEPDVWEAWHSRGLAYINLHKHDKALADFTKAIELKPKHVPALTDRAATYYFSLRQYDKALADYSKAIELEPKNVAALGHRGEIYRDHLHQYDKALSDFSKAIELDPKSAWLWACRAFTYMLLRDYEKALAGFNRAIELDPKYFDAWILRARTYVALGQKDKALADYSKVIELDAKNVAGWHERGRFYFNELHQYDKAFADFSQAAAIIEKLVRDFPHDATYAAQLFDAHRDLASTFIAARRCGEGEKFYSEAIKLQPSDAMLLWRRADFYGRLGLWDLAAKDSVAAFKLQPPATPYQCLSHALLSLHVGDLASYRQLCALLPKRFRQETDYGGWENGLSRACTIAATPEADLAWAVQRAEKGVKADPNAAWNYSALGRARFRTGEYEQAIRQLQRSLKVDPNWCSGGPTYPVLAMAYHHLGQAEKAKEALENAGRAIDRGSDVLSRGPAGTLPMLWFDWLECCLLYREAKTLIDGSPPADDPRWLVARAHAFVALGDRAKAEEACRRAVKMAEKNSGIRLACAAIAALVENWEQARANYEKCLELAPRSALPCNNLAWLLAMCPEPKFRDCNKAVQLAKQAVAMAPKEGGHWNTLGVAHYRAGNWKTAVEALDKSMQLRQGGDSFDWFFLAMAHWQRGEKDKAHQKYSDAVGWMEKNQPNNDELRRFREEAAKLLEVKEKK